VPRAGEVEYSQVLRLDLGSIAPSLAGPKRPQDRVELGQVAAQFTELFSKPAAENGFNRPPEQLRERYPVHVGAQALPTQRDADVTLGNGDVLIAAITSCTNTSNPSVMLAAGLLAKKAVEAGLTVQPHIKTSLAPGSRVVTEYLTQTGLLPFWSSSGLRSRATAARPA